MNVKLDKKYSEHSVFSELDDFIFFYKESSVSIFGFGQPGTKFPLNLDTYFFSSIQGTVESIKDILIKGRINDSYALLRKYYDSVVMNIYVNLYLSDNSSLEKIIVAKINNWVEGKEKIPEFREMKSYIQESVNLKDINEVLFNDNRYIKIRERCNDNVHYNYFFNVLINDNEAHIEKRVNILDTFYHDLCHLFILHFSLIYFLNENYMMDSYYVDCLDVGITPEEDSQYYVDPNVQSVFDNYIKKHRNDIANYLKVNLSMNLQ